MFSPQLSKAFPGFSTPLPKKGWLRQFQHSFLDKRRDGLQNFLDQILGHAEIAESPVVKEFLCLDEVSDSGMDNDPEVSCDERPLLRFPCTAVLKFFFVLCLSLSLSLCLHLITRWFCIRERKFRPSAGKLGPTSIGKKFGHGILCAPVSEIRHRGNLAGGADEFFAATASRVCLALL